MTLTKDELKEMAIAVCAGQVSPETAGHATGTDAKIWIVLREMYQAGYAAAREDGSRGSNKEAKNERKL